MKISDAAVGFALVLAGYGVTAGAATASAVVVQSLGKALVTQTTATVSAQSNLSLYPGDRIAAPAGASLTIEYPGGCRVTIPANSTLTIGATDQCSTGQAKVQTSSAPVKKPRPPTTPPPPEGGNLSR